MAKYLSLRVLGKFYTEEQLKVNRGLFGQQEGFGSNDPFSQSR